MFKIFFKIAIFLLLSSEVFAQVPSVFLSSQGGETLSGSSPITTNDGFMGCGVAPQGAATYTSCTATATELTGVARINPNLGCAPRLVTLNIIGRPTTTYVYGYQAGQMCVGNFSTPINNINWTQVGPNSPWAVDDIGLQVKPSGEACDPDPNTGLHRKVSQKGCVLTSMAVLLRTAGVATLPNGSALNPGTLNSYLKTSTPKGFHCADMILPDAVKAASSCRLKFVNQVSKNNDELLRQLLKEGYPVLVGVKLKNLPGKVDKVPTHFMVVYGTSGNDFLASDPGSFQNTVDTGHLKKLKIGFPTFPDYIIRGVLRPTGKSSCDSQRLLANANFTELTKDSSSIFIHITNNAKVLITDPLGRKSGFDSSNNKYDEIPGAYVGTEAFEDFQNNNGNLTDLSEIVVIDRPVQGFYSVTVTSSGGVNPYSVMVSSTSKSDEVFPQQYFYGTPGATETFTFNHSSGPVTPSALDFTLTTKQGETLSVSQLNGLLSMASPVGIGSNLGFKVVSNPSGGTLSVGSSGDFTYVPKAGFSGLDKFEYVITEAGYSDSAAATVRIQVNLKNTQPSFVKGADQFVSSVAASYNLPFWATNISPGSVGEELQSLTFIVTNNMPSLFSTQPRITPAGALSFSIASGAAGTAIVTVKLRDNGGTENGGADESVIQTFNIAIQPLINSTWSGLGSDSSWNTSLNWNPNLIPSDDGQSNLTFSSGFSSGSSIVVESARQSNRLNFNSSTSFSLTPGAGGSLNLKSGRLASSTSSNVEIQVPMLGSSGLLITGTVSPSSITTGALFKLNSVNNYVGNTFIERSVVSLQVNDVFPNQTALIMGASSDNILDLNAKNLEVGSLQGTGKITNSSLAGTSSLTFGNNNFSTIWQGSLGASLPSNGKAINVTKAGLGDFTASGTDSYIGSTTIKSGRYILKNTNTSTSFIVTSDGTNQGQLHLVGTAGSIQTEATAGLGGLIKAGLPSSLPGETGRASTLNLTGSGTLVIRGTKEFIFDKFILTGQLTLDGTSKLMLDLGGLDKAVTFKDAIKFSGVSGIFDPSQISTTNNPAGYLVSLVYNPTSIDIIVARP